MSLFLEVEFHATEKKEGTTMKKKTTAQTTLEARPPTLTEAEWAKLGPLAAKRFDAMTPAELRLLHKSEMTFNFWSDFFGYQNDGLSLFGLYGDVLRFIPGHPCNMPQAPALQESTYERLKRMFLLPGHE